MNIQTIFKAGNSDVVAIPKQLLEELELKTGQRVVLEKLPNEGIIIRKHSPNKKASKSKTEFKKWLEEVLKEDAEILEELALR